MSGIAQVIICSTHGLPLLFCSVLSVTDSFSDNRYDLLQTRLGRRSDEQLHVSLYLLVTTFPPLGCLECWVYLVRGW